MSKDANSFNLPPQKTPKKILPSGNFGNTRSRGKSSSILWLEEAYNTARGETALWVAVITQAMMDALSRCKKSESRYQKHEAISWLTSNSKDFIDVCLAAGMNPDYVRLKAKKILASPLPWRAEAGKGKRYEERRKYREKQKLLATKTDEPENGQTIIISLHSYK